MTTESLIEKIQAKWDLVNRNRQLRSLGRDYTGQDFMNGECSAFQEAIGIIRRNEAEQPHEEICGFDDLPVPPSRDVVERVARAIHNHEGNRPMLTHFQAECLAKAGIAAMKPCWKPISEFRPSDEDPLYWFWLELADHVKGSYGDLFLPKGPQAEVSRYRGWLANQKATYFMLYYVPPAPPRISA